MPKLGVRPHRPHKRRPSNRRSPHRRPSNLRTWAWAGGTLVFVGLAAWFVASHHPRTHLSHLRPYARAALAKLDAHLAPWADRRDPYNLPQPPPAPLSPPPDPQPAAAPDVTIDLDAPQQRAAETRLADDTPRPAPTATLRSALATLHGGHVADGDSIAKALQDPLEQLTFAWAAVRLAPKEVGLARLTGFLAANPDWPSAGWVRRRVEDALFADKDPAQRQAQMWFADHAPETPMGRVVQARVWLATGHGEEAQALIRSLWRGEDCAGGLEAHILKTYGALLTPADHAARADRMLYRDSGEQAGLRAAALAGPDVLKLAQVRVAASEGRATAALLASIPTNLLATPGAQFARIAAAREAHNVGEAARLMRTAPQDPAVLGDPDAWWAERRTLARLLLDAGDAQTALAVSAGAAPLSNENKLEAAFQTGWIALRFAQDPATAAKAFQKLADLAETPISRARAAYWQGRTAEANQNTAAAAAFYARAAQETTTFYGQKAREKLGAPPVPHIRRMVDGAGPADQAPALRVVALLFAAGERDLAAGLALDAAKTLSDPRQLAALARISQQAGDAQATLAVGKAASQRGVALDDAAFPTFGVPAYAPLSNSVEREMVYAIARQESSFQTKALSGAGARGLMQMIASTARRTAQRAKIAFSADRLLQDPAYNAQLGAAHLGDLMREQGGSLILTFAAYNAGGGRVKEWLAAHGDPRKPDVDPIDWIERIPIAETRNYVQRVMENLQIYKARFAEVPPGSGG